MLPALDSSFRAFTTQDVKDFGLFCQALNKNPEFGHYSNKSSRGFTLNKAAILSA